MKSALIIISAILMLTSCRTNTYEIHRNGFYVWHIFEEDGRANHWVYVENPSNENIQRIRYGREETNTVKYRFNAYSCDDIIEHLTAEMEGRKISAVCKNPYGEIKKYSIDLVNEMREAYKL